jgi:hypothetical protein
VCLIGVSFIGLYLPIGLYLTGVHIMGVHPLGLYLMGVHLMSVYLTGMHLIGVISRA